MEQRCNRRWRMALWSRTHSVTMAAPVDPRLSSTSSTVATRLLQKRLLFPRPSCRPTHQMRACDSLGGATQLTDETLAAEAISILATAFACVFTSKMQAIALPRFLSSLNHSGKLWRNEVELDRCVETTTVAASWLQGTLQRRGAARGSAPSRCHATCSPSSCAAWTQPVQRATAEHQNKAYGHPDLTRQRVRTERTHLFYCGCSHVDADMDDDDQH